MQIEIGKFIIDLLKHEYKNSQFNYCLYTKGGGVNFVVSLTLGIPTANSQEMLHIKNHVC